ncbi:unnamed protein product [Sphenostylis stenocarpa]|uniref:Uncharacterized protein n=1 Tax=Sphenostylis stenocarpa TaxID=92480 RepID=A0AA86TEL4_9FABA|nr:unnamed protein product [Sphenostylis stenocarpa]
MEIFDESIRKGPQKIMERFVVVGMLCAHVVVALGPAIVETLKMLEGDDLDRKDGGRGEGYGWCGGDLGEIEDWWLGRGGVEERLAKTEGHLASMAEAWADATMRGEGERAWRRLYCVDLGSCDDGHGDGCWLVVVGAGSWDAWCM